VSALADGLHGRSAITDMKPTILASLESSDLNQEEFMSMLRQEGFAPKLLKLQEQSSSSFVPDIFAAVLVVSRFDPIQSTEVLTKTSDYLRKNSSNEGRIIVCSRELLPKDEKTLRSLGANKVIQPEFWEARPVAERVIAALFGGFITSDNNSSSQVFVELDKGEKQYLECQVPYKKTTQTRKIIGPSRIMRDLFSRIKVYSCSPDSVLIRGDTGTGKELVAAAIHSLNEDRKAKKYIPINMAEITEALLASELFGHVKGAFTDATHTRNGLLVEAGDGTVFIDEIGDLDKPNQARLLRVFENREIRPVGAEHSATASFEARLIFATHRPLEEMCFNDKFRRDLYQRIKEGHTLRLPSLSERKGDLELLAKEFFSKWFDERVTYYKDIFTLKQNDYDKIVDLCIKHRFRGNIRGMRAILRSCFNDSLMLDHRFRIEYLEKEMDIERKQRERTNPERLRDPWDMLSIPFDPSRDSLKDSLHKVYAEYFPRVYRAARGSLQQAADVAGISKKTFNERAKVYIPETERSRQRRQNALDPDSEL
jgi:transcriptional regulator with PAS, ATPase and Fis domain